jgi:hypothetical protein
VFGVLLAVCQPTALFGHLPIAVVHDSQRPAALGRSALESSRQSRLSELVIDLLLRQRHELGRGSVAGRMRQAGRLLAATGHLDATRFESLVIDVTLERRAREIMALEKSLDSPACSTHWKRTAAQYRRNYLTAIQDREFFVPIEFRDGQSTDAGLRATQLFLGHYGALIEAWPDLWTRALARHMPFSQE